MLLLSSLLLAQTPPPLFTTPTYIASYGPPTLVMATATSGKERGGLLILDPRDKGNLDFQAFSELGKLVQPDQARNGFLAHSVTAATGSFCPGERVCVAIVSADGTLKVEHGFDAEKGVFTKDDAAGSVPGDWLKGGHWQATAFRASDLLLSAKSGKLILLANDGAGHFAAHEVQGRVDASRIAAGSFDGEDDLVWMNPKGEVSRATIGPSLRLENQRKLVSVEPGSGLAVGHFLDSSHSDILAGRELLADGAPANPRTLPEVAGADVARDDAEWLSADLAGDGRDDLIRVRRSSETFTADDIYAQYEPGAAEFCVSSNDGLPDAWKTGAIKPGGLDLAAMGCKPNHKDVIVEVQPMWNVSADHVKTEMKKVVAYFAGLKIQNLDGTQGVAMHVIYREAMDKSDEGKPWPELGDKYHPTNHRGITHWMEVYHGGGGQSDIMFDRGSCGDNAMAPVFTHEFGHQLGLDHNGRYRPDGCPIYPSLMNYPYNYQLNGKRENVGYSYGKLADVTLTETHLNKYLPFPPAEISFIAGPPYRFRIKPAPDGKGTLVDWNWDGDFNEKWVSADINYGYGTTAGNRYGVGKTYTTAAPVVSGSGRGANLMLFTGDLLEGAAVPVGDGAEKDPNLSPRRPGRLRVRIWQGKDANRDGDNWSAPQDVDSAVTGDPSCVSINGVAWLAYPTTDGVKVRRAEVQSGKSVLGEPTLLPSSAGVQVTLASLGGKLALCLWRGPTIPVTFQVLQPSDKASFDNSMPGEMPLGFTSESPLGAAEGPKVDGRATLWIGLTEDQDPKKPNRWQLRRFELTDMPVQLSQEWVGGDKGGERTKGRTSLLWEADKPLGPDGQVYLFATGAYNDDSPWSCGYVSMRIGEKDVNGGWLTRRYYDEWTQSRTGPGVCFFRGDIFYASRWFAGKDASNDNQFVAFFGRGIQPDPMGDFDDVSYITKYGFHRSIATLPR